jgi:hypothetical protein
VHRLGYFGNGWLFKRGSIPQCGKRHALPKRGVLLQERGQGLWFLIHSAVHQFRGLLMMLTTVLPSLPIRGGSILFEEAQVVAGLTAAHIGGRFHVGEICLNGVIHSPTTAFAGTSLRSGRSSRRIARRERDAPPTDRGSIVADWGLCQ